MNLHPAIIFRSVGHLCFLYVIFYHLTGSMWGKGLQIGGLFFALVFVIFARMRNVGFGNIPKMIGGLGIVMMLWWFHWGHPSVLLLLGSVLCMIPKDRYETSLLRKCSRIIPYVMALLVGILFLSNMIGFWDSLVTQGNAEWLMDIGWNTQVASQQFLEGNNPYAEKAQLWKVMHPNEHVSFVGSDVYLYGFSYLYGYPYFPMMLWGYAPFVWLVDGLHSIRVANGCMYLLILFFLHRISALSLHDKYSVFVLLAWLNIPFMIEEAFVDGINDMLPATIMLWGFYHYIQGGRFGSGLLFGLSQGAKLFPGFLGFLPLLVYTWQREKSSVLPMCMGFVVGACITILPFLLYDYEHFISSTILFYVVEHGMGDSSSIFYYVPEMVKPIWNIGGMLLSVFIGVFFAKRVTNIPSVMAITSIGYILFIAFNRMTHVNYLIAALPLAMVVFSPHYTWALEKSEERG